MSHFLMRRFLKVPFVMLPVDVHSLKTLLFAAAFVHEKSRKINQNIHPAILKYHFLEKKKKLLLIFSEFCMKAAPRLPNFFFKTAWHFLIFSENYLEITRPLKELKMKANKESDLKMNLVYTRLSAKFT